MKTTKLILAATFLFGSAAAFAQTTPTPGRNDYNIHQRQVEQQDRIANGLRSGQLTPRETAHLERQEGRIHREERFMRARDHGHLTRGDRRLIHHQQNRESRRIYRDKHNAARA